MEDPRRRRGRLGEALAALYLGSRGWEIVARNITLAGVQVDLLARRHGVDALVEVKARRWPPGPLPALDLLVAPKQRRRLTRAAQAWADRLPAGVEGDRLVRVDVIVILWSPWPRLRHLEDACREA